LHFPFLTFAKFLNMMRIVIIFMLAAFLSCSTDNQPADGDMVPLLAPAMQMEPYNDGSGLVRVTSYGTNGVVLEQGEYLNGYREGVYSEFHANGFVKSTVGYVNGKKQGQSIIIDDKGQVQERSTYHQDLLDGPHFKYNRSRLKEKSQYNNGQLHGVVEKYYPNGKIMERSNYNSGQLDGISRWYDQNGINTIAYNYNLGELIGDAALEANPTPAN
jgi:antitoxin component YwqK of YwqJK toxin-antitoxin module